MAKHYPGFLAAFFIILLRVAIGWHFLYEGVEKFESNLQGAKEHGPKPFSAEIYLRNANGPFAAFFRDMVPDVDGRALLDPTQLKAAWRAEANRVSDHFDYTEAQRAQAAKVADAAEQWATDWFADPENAEKVKKYLHDLDAIAAAERDPNALSYQRERAEEGRRLADSDRRSLVAPLIARGTELREAVAKLATSDQLTKAGDVAAPTTRLDLMNALVTFGLIAIGGCLVLGLLTPLSALAAAAFLAMIYLSMPPWPGLPANPKAEGHYLIVSKNLIELIACMVVATTPNGHWIGLDALLFGARRRRRLARRSSGAAPDGLETDRPGQGPSAPKETSEGPKPVRIG